MSNATQSARSKAPVFVVGCPRSGTTLLYDMLLSAGGFAVYLAESNLFNLLVPRFGDPGVESNRRRLLKVWLETKLFRAAHIDPAPLKARLSSECRHSGDFLRIFMEEICREQQVVRWADNSPEEILYLPIIKRFLPDALFVHIIRDGRAVALSLAKQGWIRPLPGDHRLRASGLYWDWIVTKGRGYGKALAGDYTEVRFEQLIADPRNTLARLGQFIHHDLDYDRIGQSGIGAVSQPNTSFRRESNKPGFDPVGRWKEAFSEAQLAEFEELVGPSLQELGYELKSRPNMHSRRAGRKRAIYRPYFDFKIWLKNTWLYRSYYRLLSERTNISQIDFIVMADDVTRPVIPGTLSSVSR